jgi:hypothetical protein
VQATAASFSTTRNSCRRPWPSWPPECRNAAESEEKTMKTPERAAQSTGHIDVEPRDPVLIARIDGGPHAVFDAGLVGQLKALVDRAARDPDIHAMSLPARIPNGFSATPPDHA